MLASTVQFSNNNRKHRPPAGAYQETPAVHTTGRNRRSGEKQTKRPHPVHRRSRAAGPVPSGPNNVPDDRTEDPPRSTPRRAVLRGDPHPRPPNSQRSTHEQPLRYIRPKRAMCSLERR